MSDEYSIIRRAKALGVSAEVFSIESKTYSINKEKAQKSGSELVDRAFTVRVVKDGKVGISYSTVLSDDILDQAMDTMRASHPDEDYQLPPAQKVSYLGNLHFPEVEDPFDKLKDYVLFFEGMEKLNVNYVIARSESFKVKVLSTEGVDVEERRSFVTLGVASNTSVGSEVSPEIYEARESRRFDINLEDIENSLREKLKITSSRVRPEIKGLDITLTTSAQEELLFPLLNFSLSGENFYRKKSIFSLNEEISPKLRIMDSPHREDGVFSRSFDGEGMPTRENLMIDSSVKTFLTNYYWSRKASIPHTSSASRNFTSLPSISLTNLVIDFRDKERNVREGTVVIDMVQGVHTVNPETGEFSVVASVAWLDDGKRQTGLRELVVNGNLKSLLSNIIAQSREERRGPVISGDLRIKDMSLII